MEEEFTIKSEGWAVEKEVDYVLEVISKDNISKII